MIFLEKFGGINIYGFTNRFCLSSIVNFEEKAYEDTVTFLVKNKGKNVEFTYYNERKSGVIQDCNEKDKTVMILINGGNNPQSFKIISFKHYSLTQSATM